MLLVSCFSGALLSFLWLLLISQFAHCLVIFTSILCVVATTGMGVIVLSWGSVLPGLAFLLTWVSLFAFQYLQLSLQMMAHHNGDVEMCAGGYA